jgi:hypothetical protein
MFYIVIKFYINFISDQLLALQIWLVEHSLETPTLDHSYL